MTMGFGVFFSVVFLTSNSSAFDGSGSLTIMAIRLPSGDQVYSSTLPLTAVTLIASPPARFISQIWAPFVSCRDDRNARYFPSGLQRGVDSLSAVEVTWTCCCPSQLTIQTSLSFLSVSLIARDTV